MSQLATSAKNHLLKFRDELNPIIELYLKKKREEVGVEVNKDVAKSIDIISDLVIRGGKRLRPSLVFYSYKMFGGKGKANILQLGLAVEILHASLLLFDDFMDLSETRRGGPTAHVMFSDHYEKRKFSGGDKKHFGYAAEVNAGVTATYFAIEIVNSLKISAEIRSLLMKNLAQKVEYTTYGQLTDITNPLRPDVIENDVLDMFKFKTSIYTFENPLHLGAILAGTGENELAKLSDYAIPAGIAFQIQDDILGVFGKPDETGKSNTDDICEGKYTLLMHFALKNGSSAQKRILKKYLGNSNLTQKEYKDVKKVLIDTGSLEYSRKMARKYVKSALDALDKNRSMLWGKNSYEYLKGIAQYMIERNV